MTTADDRAAGVPVGTPAARRRSRRTAWWTGTRSATGSSRCRTSVSASGCSASRCSSGCCSAREADGWAIVVLALGRHQRLGGRLARPRASTRSAGWARCSTRPPTGSTSWPRCSAFAVRDVVPLRFVAALLARELRARCRCCWCCAGTATARRCGALPGQGRDVPAAVRVPAAAARRRRRAGSPTVAQPIAWALTFWGPALYWLAGRALRGPGRRAASAASRRRRGRRRDGAAGAAAGSARSGASLLDQVLAETLDPAYAAARRRPGARARRPGGGTRQPPLRPAQRPLLVAVTLVASPGCWSRSPTGEAAAGAQGREQARAGADRRHPAASRTTSRRPRRPADELQRGGDATRRAALDATARASARWTGWPRAEHGRPARARSPAPVCW